MRFLLDTDALSEPARRRPSRRFLQSLSQHAGDLYLLVAATALAHDLTLVTGNRRHFERIPELVLADWFARAVPTRRR